MKVEFTSKDPLEIKRLAKSLDMACAISDFKEKLRKWDKNDLELNVDLIRTEFLETLQENSIDIDELLE